MTKSPRLRKAALRVLLEMGSSIGTNSMLTAFQLKYLDRHGMVEEQPPGLFHKWRFGITEDGQRVRAHYRELEKAKVSA